MLSLLEVVRQGIGSPRIDKRRRGRDNACMSDPGIVQRPSQDRGKSNATLLIVFVALVVGGVALGVVLRRKGSEEPPPPTLRVSRSPVETPMPAAPERAPAAEPSSPAPVAEGSGEDRLFKGAAQEELSFGELVDYLGVGAKHPKVAAVAKEFHKEFMKDPELRKAYQEFSEPPESDTPGGAAKFMDVLRQSPSFQALGQRILSQPGGEAALKQLMKDPELAGFAAQHYRSTLPAATAKIAPLVKTPKSVQGIAATNVAGANVARGGQTGATSNAIAVEPVMSVGSPQDGTGAGHSAAAPTGGSGASTGEKKGGGAIAAGGDGPGAHEVPTELGGYEEATSETMKRLLEVYPWLAPLGSAKLKRIEDQVPQYGLWGSCFALQLYPDCKSACDKDPAGKCQGKQPWNSCLEWQSLETCVSACKYASGYCAVPADIDVPRCQTTKMCSCGPKCEKPCPPPPYPYCSPAWPGGAAVAAAEPEPEQDPSKLINVVHGGGKAPCEALIRETFGVVVTCTIGGGCGVSCGMPGPDCPSANPRHWGACLTGKEPKAGCTGDITVTYNLPTTTQGGPACINKAGGKCTGTARCNPGGDCSTKHSGCSAQYHCATLTCNDGTYSRADYCDVTARCVDGKIVVTGFNW